MHARIGLHEYIYVFVAHFCVGIARPIYANNYKPKFGLHAFLKMHAHIIIQKYPIDTKHTCACMTNTHIHTLYAQLHYLAHTIVKIDAYSGVYFENHYDIYAYTHTLYRRIHIRV